MQTTTIIRGKRVGEDGMATNFDLIEPLALCVHLLEVSVLQKKEGKN